MKKLICALLCVLMLATALVACDKAPSEQPEATLKMGLGVYTATPTTTDATEEKDGSNQVETTIFAAAVDADGKVIKGFSDCVQLKFGFDATGKATAVPTEIKSKFELGSNYGMTAIGKQEWYIQAAAFDAACIGKTGIEIAALATADGKGVESLQTAGCTITVTGLVKAASKI